jgi:parvulin-like peptidyl-prolyl isomerase
MEVKMSRLILAALAAAALAASAVEIDGVAAKVGSETILKSDVIDEMRRMGVHDASRYGEIRNEMIDRKLILKAAADAKMSLQDWVVENRMREIIAKAFGGDRNKLIETLGRQRMSYPEWQARMKEDMIVAAMRWNVVNKNVTASPAAMRAEFESHPERYAKPATVSVSVIMLKPEEKDRRREISAKLKEVDFDKLGAKRYEGVKPEDVFSAELCKEIAALPKGTISRWIEMDGWSFLVRKDAEDAGAAQTFDEAYDKIAENVKEEAAKKAYKAWIDRLRAETYIKVF